MEGQRRSRAVVARAQFVGDGQEGTYIADIGRGTRKTKGVKAAPWVTCDGSERTGSSTQPHDRI